MTEDLSPALDAGARLPEHTAGIPLLALVPSYCLRCSLWTEDHKLRRRAARVHLEALVRTGHTRPAAFAGALEAARRATRDPRVPGVRAAAQHLQQARHALAACGRDAAALRPLLERDLRAFTKHLATHPEEVDHLAGLHEPPPLTNAAWDRYLALLEHRADAEGSASFARDGDAATLHVRGWTIRVTRAETVPHHQGSTVHVLGAATPTHLARLSPGAILVRAEGAGAGIFAPPTTPTWLLHLLDPLPDDALAARFLAEVRAQPAWTEGFVAAVEHEAHWPVAVLDAAFESSVEAHTGRIRTIDGLGKVLITE